MKTRARVSPPPTRLGRVGAPPLGPGTATARPPGGARPVTLTAHGPGRAAGRVRTTLVGSTVCVIRLSYLAFRVSMYTYEVHGTPYLVSKAVHLEYTRNGTALCLCAHVLLPLGLRLASVTVCSVQQPNAHTTCTCIHISVVLRQTGHSFIWAEQSAQAH